jgi:hypothetical protein
VRRALYAAALSAFFRWNLQLMALYRRLIAAGNEHKRALITCARKLLIFINRWACDDCAGQGLVLPGRAARRDAANRFDRPSAQRRKIKVWRLLRGIFSLPRVGLDLLEACATLIGSKNEIGVKERTDRISTKIFRCAHPFCRCVPISEIVNLQLNHVLIGIRIVKRHRQSVIETYLGLDALLLQTRVG